MRGRPINPKTNAEGEIDENFWAQAAADHAAGRSGEDGNESKFPHFVEVLGILEFTLFTHFVDGDEQAIPFNTQFFHDDFDDDGAGFDDGDDGGGIGSAVPGVEGDEPDLMATLAGSSRRIRPQYVNYTKKAKRVDVRKLKENIWRSLDIKISKQDDADESMVRVLTFFFSVQQVALLIVSPFLSLGRGRRRGRRLDRPKRASSVRLSCLEPAENISEGQNAGY